MQTRCLPLSGTHLRGHCEAISSANGQHPAAVGASNLASFGTFLKGIDDCIGLRQTCVTAARSPKPAPGYADGEGFTVIQRPAGQGRHAFVRITPTTALKFPTPAWKQAAAQVGEVPGRDVLSSPV